MISQEVDQFRRANVLSLKGPELLTGIFTSCFTKLFDYAYRGSHSAGEALTLFQQFYPDVFSGLSQTEEISFVDPRKDILNPWNNIALSFQKESLATLRFEIAQKKHSLVVIRDTQNTCGVLPLFLRNPLKEQERVGDLFNTVGKALTGIQGPIIVDIKNITMIGEPDYFTHRTSIGHYDDILKTKPVLEWLDFTKYRPKTIVELNDPIVSAFNSYASVLPSHYDQLTVSSESVKTTIGVLDPSSGHKHWAASNWSVQDMLNVISRVSTQQALHTANELCGALPQDLVVNPELTVLAFLANHAQVITAPFHRVTITG